MLNHALTREAIKRVDRMPFLDELARITKRSKRNVEQVLIAYHENGLAIEPTLRGDRAESLSEDAKLLIIGAYMVLQKQWGDSGDLIKEAERLIQG